MKFKLLFFSLATLCSLSLGYAQCPDSVRVYVYPEVICPGEVVHLSTDSTLLHCVNIGDIICVNSNTQDTAIVSPSDWTRLNRSSTYTPLSVVFYVDETCRHGWAVEAKTDPYTTNYAWGLGTVNFSATPLVSAILDTEGFSHTSFLLTASPNKPAAVQAHTNPLFYLPASGQLNVLYTNSSVINASLTTCNCSNFPPVNHNQPDSESNLIWSSSYSYSNNTKAIALNWLTGIYTEILKTKKTPFIIPVMNF